MQKVMSFFKILFEALIEARERRAKAILKSRFFVE